MKDNKKKPTKGVRYIASVLKRYQEKKYPSNKEAMPEARKILAKLKSEGKRVNIKNIWGESRGRRKSKDKGVPFLHPKLPVVSPYFTITLYPNYIAASSNQIIFVSDIIPANLPEIQGGEIIDYYTYFAPFVNYINKIVSNTDRRRYEAEFQVYCTTPQKNPNKGNRWESIILCVDEYGDPTDYGFDPKNPDADPDSKEWTPTEPAKEEPSKPSEPTTPSEPAKPTSDADKIRLAELRNEALRMLQEDYKAGIYTKEEYKIERAKIMEKYEKGGSI
jgi:hypothetical protein